MRRILQGRRPPTPAPILAPTATVQAREKWASSSSGSSSSSSSGDSPVVPLQALEEFKARLSRLGGGSCHVEKDESTGLAIVELRNENSRNALSGRMMVQLADVVASLHSWSQGTALILRGQGSSSFCSGVDLRLARDTLVGGAEGALMSRLMTGTLNSMRRLPMVSVAVINGPAVGGGAELATACDLRVMDGAAHIKFVQSRMGTSTGFGGTSRLVKLVGRENAIRLLLLKGGRPVHAEEALHLGLVNEIADNKCPQAVALELLEQVLGGKTDAGAVRALKAVIAHTDDVHSDHEEHETQLFSCVWGQPANRSAIHNK